jgi:hypothetical protein
MRFRLSEYTLRSTAEDLAPWRWLLPTEGRVVLMNLFAEAVVELADGSVHYLDTGGGKLERIASSPTEFLERLEDQDNANDWLMIPLVRECRAAGLEPGPGECLAFRVLPTLGGRYDLDNVFVSKRVGYIGFSALVHEQIRDLPDGAHVEIVLTP